MKRCCKIKLIDRSFDKSYFYDFCVICIKLFSFFALQIASLKFYDSENDKKKKDASFKWVGSKWDIWNLIW